MRGRGDSRRGNGASAHPHRDARARPGCAAAGAGAGMQRRGFAAPRGAGNADDPAGKHPAGSLRRGENYARRAAASESKAST